MAASAGGLKIFTEENGNWVAKTELGDIRTTDAVIHPDGEIIISSGDKIVILSQKGDMWQKEVLPNSFKKRIRVVHLLENGDIVTGGDGKMIYILSKNELGDWGIKHGTFNGTIKGSIQSITTLADGSVVGADYDKIYLILDKHGKLRQQGPLASMGGLSINVSRLMMKEHRQVEHEFRSAGYNPKWEEPSGGIESICGMPDGGIAVKGWEGSLRVLRKGKLGTWSLKPVVNFTITTSEITPVDDRLVVGGQGGELISLKENDWGGLDQVERIAPERGDNENHQPIKKIAVLKNGDIVTGSEGGEIAIFSQKTNLASLKEKLEKIIKKGETKN